MDHAAIGNNPGNVACDKNATVELVVFVSANAGRPVSPVTQMQIVREAGTGISGGSVTSAGLNWPDWRPRPEASTEAALTGSCDRG